MLVRQLIYLVAVARNRHFARAAAECHVPSPRFRPDIRKLEEELGTPLVIRGHRFLGLTPEGERVLAWAQRIILDYDSLKQDLEGRDAGLTGTLRLAAIPAALPAVPLLTTPFCARHGAVQVQIRSLSSIAIQRGLDELEIDAGLTYLENEPLTRVRRLLLYRERYLFITGSEDPLSDRGSISWAEAATRPLCLLTPDMQNRRIINQNFHEVGIDPRPRIETNSFSSIWAHVRSGPWASIVPHTYVHAFGRSRKSGRFLSSIQSDRRPSASSCPIATRCRPSLRRSFAARGPSISKARSHKTPPRCRPVDRRRLSILSPNRFDGAGRVRSIGGISDCRFRHSINPRQIVEGRNMAKIVCVLYDDPVDGYPKSYARDDIPKLERYPDGQTLPTPKAIDFKPGELLGSVSGELGLAQIPRSAADTRSS